MKNVLVILLIAATLFSCKESSSTNSETTAIDSTSSTMTSSAEKILTTGCYGFHQNGDKINFTITSVEDSVLGNIEYSLAEKDMNSGKFSGMIYGDKLMGTYRFFSEGMRSNRQMAFTINDNSLVEGFGDVKEISAAVVFKDTATLKYDLSKPLTRDSCQ